MKTRVLLLTLSTLFLLQVSAQTELLTLAENNLRGPVKSASTTVNWMKEKFGELEIQSLYYSEYCAFNKEGFLTASWKEESSKYKSDYSFKYDRDNHLVQKRDEYGKEKEKKQHIWKSVYDAQGRETEQNLYDGKETLFWKHKMKYREDGKMKESVYYNGDGRVSISLVYTYDNQGRLSTTSTSNAEGRVFKKVTVTYDQQQNKIKEETIEDLGKAGTNVTYDWTYVNNRKTRETKLSFNNGKQRRTVEEFDQWGNVIKRVEDSGTVMTTTYTFDSYNNWITATCSWDGFDGPVTYRKVREIKYY